MDLRKTAEKSKAASRETALLSDAVKKNALEKAAAALLANQAEILKANEKDVAAARKAKLSPALIDRLTLTPKRVEAMAQALREIAGQSDPVGEVVEERKTSDGIRLRRVRVPLGVVAMVYESRPNVTVESAALCLKAGNSVILRGGSEAIHSNRALGRIFSEAVEAEGIPPGAVAVVQDTDRKSIYALARMHDLIDLLIARGSEAMVTGIREKATVPVLGHGKGVCHVYVDEKADLKMAEQIAYNAKVQRPGVCNAMETLLVHKAVARQFMPAIGERYRSAGVILKGDSASRKLFPGMKKASEGDWSEEYHDLVLSIKVVDSVDDAIRHINRYGSGHTDAIVSSDDGAAERFLKGVDSAAVFHNVSTRMHDGGVFGFGAEIGISTQKLHARGSMGARELTTTKFVGEGSGHIRK
jgi:glutamate-5-semialdehyde dehydrogenase